MLLRRRHPWSSYTYSLHRHHHRPRWHFCFCCHLVTSELGLNLLHRHCCHPHRTVHILLNSAITDRTIVFVSIADCSPVRSASIFSTIAATIPNCPTHILSTALMSSSPLPTGHQCARSRSSPPQPFTDRCTRSPQQSYLPPRLILRASWWLPACFVV